MPKPNKQVIISETVKLIAKGDSTEKIISVICSKFQFTKRTGYNYLKIAAKQHTEAQGLINKAKAEDNTLKAINDEIAHKFDILKKTDFCVAVIKGDFKITLKKPFWNPEEKKMQFVPVENPADFNERLKALAELNKMEGEYASTKISAEISGELKTTDLSHLSFEELLKLSNASRAD